MDTQTSRAQEQVDEVIAALKEMERLKRASRLMGAVSPDGHFARSFERHALARIAAAVGMTGGDSRPA